MALNEPRISVPLPQEFLDRLEMLAQQDDRSVAKQAAWFLKKCIQQAIEEGKIPPLPSSPIGDEDE